MIIRGLSVYVVSELIAKIVPFATIFVIAKMINPEAFGQLTLFFVIYEFAVILIGNNLNAVTRIDFFKQAPEEFQIGKTSHIATSIVFAIVSLFIMLMFKSIIPLDLMFLSIIIVSSLFRTISMFFLTKLQCQKKSGVYTLLNLVYILVLNVSFIAMVYFGGGITSWFYSLFLGALCQMFFGFILEGDLRLLAFGKIKQMSVLIGEFLKGIIFLPQAIGFWIKLGIDRIILADLSTAYILGQYMFGFQLSYPILIISTAMNLYLTPLINEQIKNKEYDSILRRLKQFSLILLLGAVGVYFISIYVLEFWFSGKYLESKQYVLPVVIALLFQATMLIFLNVFYYIGKSKLVSAFVLVTSLINLVAGYYITGKYGVFGLITFNIIYSGLLAIIVILKLKSALKLLNENESSSRK